MSGKAIFVGGPLDPSIQVPGGSTDAPNGDHTGEGDATHPAPIATQPPAPANPSPVMIGDKVFHSTEEALAYANGLASASRHLPQTPSPQQPIQPQPAEILFEDPAAALAMVEDRIVQRISSQTQTERAEQNIWENFYRSYPDLQGNEDVVALMNSQLPKSVKDMPISQALPILANNARERIARIRGGAADRRQILPSVPAITAGAGGATPPAPPVAPPKSTSFVDEVRALRHRH